MLWLPSLVQKESQKESEQETGAAIWPKSVFEVNTTTFPALQGFTQWFVLSLVLCRMNSSSPLQHCFSFCCQVVLLKAKQGLFCQTAARHGRDELPHFTPVDCQPLAACAASAALLISIRFCGCDPASAVWHAVLPCTACVVPACLQNCVPLSSHGPFSSSKQQTTHPALSDCCHTAVVLAYASCCFFVCTLRHTLLKSWLCKGHFWCGLLKFLLLGVRDSSARGWKKAACIPLWSKKARWGWPVVWYLSVKKFPRNIPYYSQLVKVIVQIWLFPLHIHRPRNNSLACEQALKGLWAMWTVVGWPLVNSLLWSLASVSNNLIWHFHISYNAIIQFLWFFLCLLPKNKALKDKMWKYQMWKIKEGELCCFMFQTTATVLSGFVSPAL